MMTYLERWRPASEAAPGGWDVRAQTTEGRSLVDTTEHGPSRGLAGIRDCDGWIILGFAAFSLVVIAAMWLTSAESGAFGADLAVAAALL